MFYVMYASVCCVCAYPFEKTARTGCGLSWTVFMKFKSTIPPNLKRREEANEISLHAEVPRNKEQELVPRYLC